MKKIISLILSAIMLLSVTAGMSFNAFAKVPVQIDGVGSASVIITASYENVKVWFKPTETAEYYIHSTGDYDTTATFYLIDGEEYEELDYNDDDSSNEDPDNYNFGIYYKCEKGKTYAIECGTYDGVESSIEFKVVVEKSPIKSVTFTKAKVNSVTEFTGGDYDTDENGKKYYNYDIYDLAFAAGDKLTVNYIDGTKKEYVGKQDYWTDDEGGKHYYFGLYDSNGNYARYNLYDDQYDNHWKVGRHYITFEVYGKSFNVPIDIIAKGWYKKSNKWHYSKNGADLKWRQKINGKYYYFNGAGAMMTGWIKGGTWMYGKSDGSLATGWLKVGGKWYYFKADGSMTTGWQKVGGKWYYMNSSGAMTTGWQKVGGKWYYMNSSGAMTTGWQKIGGKWYYLESSGAMRTANLKQGGKTYRFNSSGACINP